MFELNEAARAAVDKAREQAGGRKQRAKRRVSEAPQVEAAE
jgi:hypothetical protein